MKKIILLLLLLSACGGQSIKELPLEMKVWCQDSLQKGLIAGVISSVDYGKANTEDLQAFAQFKLIYEEVTGKKISSMSTQEVAYVINMPKYALDDIKKQSMENLNIFKKDKLNESEVEICEVWYKAFR